jgi:hypothetical protein
MNDKTQASIDAVRAEQQSDAARIRARRDLTPEGKRSRLEVIDEAARKQMSELQAGAAGNAEAQTAVAHIETRSGSMTCRVVSLATLSRIVTPSNGLPAFSPAVTLPPFTPKRISRVTKCLPVLWLRMPWQCRARR